MSERHSFTSLGCDIKENHVRIHHLIRPKDEFVAPALISGEISSPTQSDESLKELRETLSPETKYYA